MFYVPIWKNCETGFQNFALLFLVNLSNFELRFSLLSSINNLVSQNY